VCLSKGLGAPVGSVLVGEAGAVSRARRWRKMLGGAMRQSGVLAAAGLYALEHVAPRLAEDHDRAAHLADTLRAAGGRVRQATNMVFLQTPPGGYAPLHDHMTRHGVRIGGEAPEIRLVLHRDVDDAALNAAAHGFTTYFENGPGLKNRLECPAPP